MLLICNILYFSITYGIFKYMSKTEQTILKAAAKVLGQDPSTTMNKVAEVAGVSRMTLHRYFNTRQALIEGTFKELIRNGNQIVEEALASSNDPLVQLEYMLKGDISLGDFSLLQNLWHEQLDDSILTAGEALNDSLNLLLETLKAEGVINASLSTAWLNHFYFAVLEAAWQALQDGSVAPNDLPELAWTSFSRGVIKA